MKKVRLALWVHYDSEDGFVWPQIYSSLEEAHLDEEMNRPIKVLKLVSEPYAIKRKSRTNSSFGTVLPISQLEENK